MIASSWCVPLRALPPRAVRSPSYFPVPPQELGLDSTATPFEILDKVFLAVARSRSLNSGFFAPQCAFVKCADLFVLHKDVSILGHHKPPIHMSEDYTFPSDYLRAAAAYMFPEDVKMYDEAAALDEQPFGSCYPTDLLVGVGDKSNRNYLRAGMLKIHLERFGAVRVPSAVTKTPDVLAIPTRVYVPWDGLPQIMRCRHFNELPCEIFFPGEDVWKFYEAGFLAQKALGMKMRGFFIFGLRAMGA